MKSSARLQTKAQRSHIEHLKGKLPAPQSLLEDYEANEVCATFSDPDLPQLLPLPVRPASSYDPKPAPVTDAERKRIALLTDVRAGLPFASMRAARALTQEPHELASSAVPKLLESAADADCRVRRSSVLALGSMGAAAAASLDHLLERFSIEDDDDGRSAIAWSLGMLVSASPHAKLDAVVLALSSLAQDESAPLVVRANAVCALGNPASGESSGLAALALAKAVTGRNAVLRQEALRSLQSIPTRAAATEDVMAVLTRAMQCVDDDDGILWRSARCALVCLGEASIPALLGLLKADDREVRGRAMRALFEFKFGTHAAIPASLVQELCGHLQNEPSSSPEPEMHQRAANLLEKIVKIVEEMAKNSSMQEVSQELDTALRKEAAPAVVRALCSDTADTGFREQLTRVLQHLGNRAIPALVEASPGADQQMRGLILDLMSRRAGQGDCPAILTDYLVSQMAGDDAASRIAAVKVFEQTRESLPEDGASALASALRDEDSEVREAAAAVLKGGGRAAAAALLAAWDSGQSSHADILVEIGKPAVALLAELLENSDKEENLRAQAAKVLGQLGMLADEATPALVRTLSNERLRSSAADALLAIGSVPALAALLNAKEPGVKHLDILSALDEATRSASQPQPPPMPVEDVVRWFFLVLETAHRASQLASRAWKSRQPPEEKAGKRKGFSLFLRCFGTRSGPSPEVWNEKGATWVARLYKSFSIPPWCTRSWLDCCTPDDAGTGSDRLKDLECFSACFEHRSLRLDAMDEAAASCSSALAEFLIDDDVQTRSLAARILSKLPAASVPAICALREALLYEIDPNVIAFATWALLNIGVMSYASIDVMYATFANIGTASNMALATATPRNGLEAALPQFALPPPLPPGLAEEGDLELLPGESSNQLALALESFDQPRLALESSDQSALALAPPLPGVVESSDQLELKLALSPAGTPRSPPPGPSGLPRPGAPGGSPLVGTPRSSYKEGRARPPPPPGPPGLSSPGALPVSRSSLGTPTLRSPRGPPGARTTSPVGTPRGMPPPPGASRPPLPGAASPLGTPTLRSPRGPPGARRTSPLGTPRSPLETPLGSPRGMPLLPGGAALSSSPLGSNPGTPPRGMPLLPGGAALSSPPLGSNPGTPPRGMPLLPGALALGPPSSSPLGSPLGTPPLGMPLLPGALGPSLSGALEDSQRPWDPDFEPQMLLARGMPPDFSRRSGPALLPPMHFATGIQDFGRGRLPPGGPPPGGPPPSPPLQSGLRRAGTLSNMIKSSSRRNAAPSTAEEDGLNSCLALRP